jgi:hypothetical protein
MKEIKMSAQIARILNLPTDFLIETALCFIIPAILVTIHIFTRFPVK